MRGLTALFGMGRGEHPRQKHHKAIQGHLLLRSEEKMNTDNNVILGKVVKLETNKIKASGQLVLLGFSVTTFTPIAYQRHSL